MNCFMADVFHLQSNTSAMKAIYLLNNAVSFSKECTFYAK